MESWKIFEKTLEGLVPDVGTQKIWPMTKLFVVKFEDRWHGWKISKGKSVSLGWVGAALHGWE